MVAKRLRQPAATDTNNEWRQANTGRLLINAARRYEIRALKHVTSNGFPEVTATHMAVPRNLDLEGTRITELAKRCAMTKQSMSELVRQCENMGFVKLSPDPRDGRAKTVVFTARGRKLLVVIRAAIDIQERGLERLLGKAALHQVRAALTTFNFAADTTKSQETMRSLAG